MDGYEKYDTQEWKEYILNCDPKLTKICPDCNEVQWPYGPCRLLHKKEYINE